MNDNLADNPTSFNYKRANWRKFNKQLLKTYTDDINIPYDRNLSIDEIDNFINLLENKICETIKTAIPKVKKKEDYFIKYDNKNIKRLHSYKSFLLRRQFDNTAISYQEKNRIKATINRINKLLHKEFRKTVTSYWTAQIKAIDYKNSQEFFPKINRLLRSHTDISINTLKIPNDNSPLSKHLAQKYPELTNTNELIATDPDTKLYIIGKYLESINSPRYTNIGTQTKTKVDKLAEDIKN